MEYIVFDLEFNQPFNFKSGKKTKLNPNCPFEIIQIGAVKLDSDLEIIDTFNSLIKPSIYKRLHPFVGKITGFDISMFENSPSFKEAYLKLIEFMGEAENCILCTWGIDDIKALFRNIIFYKLDYSLVSFKYINIQGLANSYLDYPQGKSIGLKNAVELLEIPQTSVFHNALNDALYTGKIFKAVKPNEFEPSLFSLTELKPKKKYKPVRLKNNTV